jgi:Domain of Unknown Function with PDB structure (DUF3857)/Transglutaminase-like superfamily
MRKLKFAALLFASVFSVSPCVAGNNAPQWMHDLTTRVIPPQDDRTNAVLLYSETNVEVVSAEKVITTVRAAYKVLRPDGRDYGDLEIPFNFNQKVTSIRGWCIPAQGKDFEVTEKQALEIGIPKIEGSELIDDAREKLLHIPAPDPSNIIGYEFRVEERPLLLQDIWAFQQEVPVLESRYSLRLPPGWEYKPVWLNAPEQKPTQSGSNYSEWVVTSQKAVRHEQDMPPFRAVAGRLVLSFIAPGNVADNGVTSWQQLGNWYRNLTAGRTDPSPELKQKVAELTASAHTPLEKMNAIAQFMQHSIRYVAISLGIGGWQPHPAKDVFAHHYGDCKDKATLMSSMLREIGVDSFYVIINTERGGVGPNTPAYNGFNHAILAIKLPNDVADPSLMATIQHPKLGKLLIFDPTDQVTPFGEVHGHLQANYGMLVTPDGGELIEVPQQPSSMNGVHRVAKFSLDASGNLKGDVEEIRRGYEAWWQRWMQRDVTAEKDRIKPVELLLGNSLSNFRITKANMINFAQVDRPFGFDYTFEVGSYAKTAGNLLLVRPRVLGTKSRGILEKDRPRESAIEFDAPEKDVDRFEITLPPGYEVDELPPPVDADFSFASYHSRTEAKDNTIVYTRTFEIKELSVPLNKTGDLKRLYRIIANDERNTAVLRPK